MPDTPPATQLAVIGAGPGGYAAAFLAADLGMKVTLVDAQPQPGGECLHHGCIPSKALLHVASLLRETRRARDCGIHFAEPQIDLDALRRWTREDVVGKLAAGLTELCRRRKVELIRARAMFADATTLRLQPIDGFSDPDVALHFDHAVLATGSSPAMPAALDVADPRVMDSAAALALPDIPGRLLIVGGGYIGLEMATVYAALGSRVTVVEMTAGLLPGIDRDLVRILQRSLRTSLHAVCLDTAVEGLTPQDDGMVASLRGDGIEPKQTFDRVLVAVGRRPNTHNLGLENTGVRLDDAGFVRVDEHRRTHEPSIFAVGDITGQPMLAHKASREAKVAVETIAGRDAVFDHVIPAVVFTDPEIAYCGLTETQAEAEGRDVRITKVPWAASGRAVTLGRTDGMTKLLFDPDSKLLVGAALVGAGAGELIAEAAFAIERCADADDLAGTIHPHPTLSETIAEAAEMLLGEATHVMRPRR